MHSSQNDQASVFGISGIPYQGHSKCYQPWPSAWLVTLTLILIILDITKTKSNDDNNYCFIIHCFEETLYTEPQNTLALLLRKQGDYQGIFILRQDMRALMYYYTYSMRCNWWFWEKPLGIFKFSVSSFNFCVCRSVKIQNGNDNNVLHLVLTTSSSLNIEALMIKICFAQWPDNYNNYISTIIVVNCCTALY